jgi:hypothetical protein
MILSTTSCIEHFVTFLVAVKRQRQNKMSSVLKTNHTDNIKAKNVLEIQENENTLDTLNTGEGKSDF